MHPLINSFILPVCRSVGRSVGQTANMWKLTCIIIISSSSSYHHHNQLDRIINFIAVVKFKNIIITYIHTYIHTYTHTHAHTNTRARTHTRTSVAFSRKSLFNLHPLRYIYKTVSCWWFMKATMKNLSVKKKMLLLNWFFVIQVHEHNTFRVFSSVKWHTQNKWMYIKLTVGCIRLLLYPCSGQNSRKYHVMRRLVYPTQTL